MNRKIIAAAVLAATTLGTSAAFADEAKHGFRQGHVVSPRVVVPHHGVSHYGAPRYVTPAPIYRHAAPVVNHRYLPPVSYNYGHNNHRGHGHNGYWNNGRWIAPVIIGAAVLGTVAAANHYYAPPVVTYVNPVPVYGNTIVNTAPNNCDIFCQADRDQNGVVDKVEASYDRTWEKWFYDIDRNNDGFITRQEVGEWNRVRSPGRY
jgi:EF hand